MTDRREHMKVMGKKGQAAIQARADAFAEKAYTVIREARRGGHSFATVAALLNLAAIPAPRGGRWLASTVQRVERRMAGGDAGGAS